MNVVLKNIDLSEAKLVAKWKSDPGLANQIMSNFVPTSSDDAKSWIEKNSADPGQRLFGIYLDIDSSRQLLGVTRLMYIDFESGVAEFGIYLGEEKHRNLGIGSQSLDKILQIAFDELGLRKIFLKVSSENKSAIALYKKKNFREEGRLREHFLIDNVFEDVLYMAVFKEDYR